MKPPPRRSGWLFEPVSNASLTLYRTLFGGVAAAVVVHAAWANSLGMGYMISAHEATTIAVLALAALGGIGVAAGWQYRVSALTLTAGCLGGAVLLGEPPPGPLTVVALLGGVLAVTPAHRRWSVDVWQTPSKQGSSLPRWGVTLLQGQSALVCYVAGLSQLQGLPQIEGFAVTAGLGSAASLAAHPWAPIALAWGGIALGAVAGPAMFRRRIRGGLLLLGAVAHLAAAALAPTFLLAVLMVAAATLFLPPDWPLRAVGRPESGWVRASRYTGGLTPLRCLGVTVVALYFSLQLAAVSLPQEETPAAPEVPYADVRP